MINRKEKNRLKSSKSTFSIVCGAIGIFGCFAAALADIIGIIVVEKHNPITETISKLAIGKYAWIQDIGLDFLAAGFFMTAIGLYRWNLNGWKWKTGTILLGLLTIVILIIAEYNEYANRESFGATIHLACVVVLALFFSLLTLLLAPGLGKISRRWSHFSVSISIIWTILSPIFFLIQTSWDGAYERFLGLIVFTWTITVSWLLIRNGMGLFKTSKAKY